MTDALTNRVERCFNKLECSRRLATRYDKTAAGLSRLHSNRSRAPLGQEFVNMTQITGTHLPSWVSTRSPGLSVSMIRLPSGVAICVPRAKQLMTCAPVGCNPSRFPFRQAREVSVRRVVGDEILCSVADLPAENGVGLASEFDRLPREGDVGSQERVLADIQEAIISGLDIGRGIG